MNDKSPPTIAQQVAAPFARIEDDGQIALLYPDLLRSGSLGKLLCEVLLLIDSPLLPVGYDESNKGSRYWATVGLAENRAQVCTALLQRLFSAEVWRRGVSYGFINTPDSQEMAEALELFIAKEATLGEMKHKCLGFVARPDAVAHELGAATYVALRWERLLKQNGIPELTPLIEAAHAQPLLRQLMPYTSLNRLCFSRYTGFPFSYDCPIAVPASAGRFQVFSAEAQFADGKGHLIGGVADAVESAVFLSAALPHGCGPATHGTSDEK